MKTLSKNEAKSYAGELLLKHYGIKVEDYTLMELSNLVDELRFFIATSEPESTNWSKLLRTQDK